MQEELMKRARECRFFRGALLDLAAELPPEDEALDEMVGEAVARRENDAFVRILFAALGTGRRVNARHLVEGACLFQDGQQLAAAAWHLSGDVPRALIGAVQHELLDAERNATALLLAGLWCKEKGNVAVPPELIVQARVQARRAGRNLLGDFQVGVLADILQDPGLSEVLASKGLPPPPAPLADDFISELIGPSRESPLGILPEKPGPIVHSGYTMRRAVVRIGRNDPCPCGSGKKYKRCCIEKDQQRLQESSPVAGLTLAELREKREHFLSEDEILGMRSYELARLDPVRVAPSLRPLLINCLHMSGEIEAAVHLFEKTGVSEDLRDHWLDCIHSAARSQRKDLLVRLMNLQDPVECERGNLPFAARLLLADESHALAIIEETAVAGLKDPDGEPAVELAYALLEGQWPALGILISRGLVVHRPLFDAEILFDTLLETRDKLRLPPYDPLQSVLDERFDASIEAHRDSEALQSAHERLETKNQELGEARLKLAKLQTELERREKETRTQRTAAAPMPAAAPQPAADATAAAAIDELRRRAASLKVELKELHTERNQLRGELKTALGQLEELRQEEAAATETAEAESTEEGLLDEPGLIGVQPARIPEFSQKFRASLEEMPARAVRHAMLLIGRLAAGESSAFVGIKRLRASREIFRQRVGADHRLLFRLHARTIELLALIQRRDLERKIKSLTTV